jgi:hypothetical protein
VKYPRGQVTSTPAPVSAVQDGNRQLRASPKKKTDEHISCPLTEQNLAKHDAAYSVSSSSLGSQSYLQHLSKEFQAIEQIRKIGLHQSRHADGPLSDGFELLSLDDTPITFAPVPRPSDALPLERFFAERERCLFRLSL